ncbi:OpgC domain-containing protein [Bradyrhizobium sp. 141]|uniref:OpgC family protein n=1 Tax=Bradyrhizobium sp. 141 TaxID=2782617 RepID=UPI001FF9AE2C|nr:OpgC domain-containing protein [Bradyrhizobium sp. 141]MCK1719490.1 OpgC domain-containing protein [Bradyrhizobium sp. 141]
MSDRRVQFTATPVASPPAVDDSKLRVLQTRSRDERLDFFRGITMFIIFLAHMPGNSWNGFIPARFGFSSGAELFVFCSGFASAIAFGGTFMRSGMSIGTARIIHRIWQVYWAELCLVLALITLAAASDAIFGLDILRAQFGPLLTEPGRALLGIVTLTWQPDLLDILPMYIAILAMVPVMIGARRIHPLLPFAISFLLYAAVWSTGLNLPGNPWTGSGWFLNPFAWQAIFFIGFAIKMEWLAVPRLAEPKLFLACAIFVAASVPLSFWVILERWPELDNVRDLLLNSQEKTDLHPLRILHFLALAYVVVSLIDPWRTKLGKGVGRMVTLIGQQSLATFLASVVLARFGATLAELAGGSEFAVAAINFIAFAALYAVARLVRWFKQSPWRAPTQASALDCPGCMLMRNAN